MSPVTNNPEESPLPPLASPSVVDTRIPQARQPSMSVTYTAAPPSVLEEDANAGKITVEDTAVKPSAQLSGSVATASPLSTQSAAPTAPRQGGATLLKQPATPASTPVRSTRPIPAPRNASTPVGVPPKNGSVVPARTGPVIARPNNTMSAKIAAPASSMPTKVAAPASSMPTKVTAPAPSMQTKVATPVSASIAKTVPRTSTAAPLNAQCTAPTSIPRPPVAPKQVSSASLVAASRTVAKPVVQTTNGRASVPQRAAPARNAVLVNAPAASTTPMTSVANASAATVSKATVRSAVQAPASARAPIAQTGPIARPVAAAPTRLPATNNTSAPAPKPIGANHLAKPAVARPVQMRTVPPTAARTQQPVNKAMIPVKTEQRLVSQQPAIKASVPVKTEQRLVSQHPANKVTVPVKTEQRLVSQHPANKVTVPVKTEQRPVSQASKPALPAKPRSLPVSDAVARASAKYLGRFPPEPPRTSVRPVTAPLTTQRTSTVLGASRPTQLTRPLAQSQAIRRPVVTSALNVARQTTARPAVRPTVPLAQRTIKPDGRIVKPVPQSARAVGSHAALTKPWAKPNLQRTQAEIALAVAQNARQLVAAASQRVVKPVARTLFPPAGATATRPAGNPAMRAGPSGVNKPAASAKLTNAAAVNTRPAGTNGMVPGQRKIIKVVHPQPVVKTLTRPSARVMSTADLANIRTTPRTTAHVVRAKPITGGVAGVQRTVGGNVSVMASTIARPATSGAQPATMTEGHQKIVASVPNMTQEIFSAAVAAAAAVEPTPPLAGPGDRVVRMPATKPVLKTTAPAPAVVQSTPVRVAPPRPAPPRATPVRVVPPPAPRPRLVTPAPAAQPVQVNVIPTPVPSPMYTPAEIPAGMTFRDGEHVTIWNRLEKRKIAGNAAPLGKNLARYLREHHYCEVFTNQDVEARANRRKRQKFNVEEAAAGEHVPIWNRKEQRKIAGNASPLAKNLDKYLASRPNCEVYTNQDVVLKEQQQKEAAIAEIEEQAAIEAASAVREMRDNPNLKEEDEEMVTQLYDDPFCETALPLEEWRAVVELPEPGVVIMDDDVFRHRASMLLGLYKGEDEDDISTLELEPDVDGEVDGVDLAVPGDMADIDINAFLDEPLPGLEDEQEFPLIDEFMVGGTNEVASTGA